MSYEGYVQVWCENGHEWYETPCTTVSEYDTCHVCNKPHVQSNDVDDTNIDDWGIYIPREENRGRAPTDAELSEGRGHIHREEFYPAGIRLCFLRCIDGKEYEVAFKLGLDYSWIFHPEPVLVTSL